VNKDYYCVRSAQQPSSSLSVYVHTAVRKITTLEYSFMFPLTQSIKIYQEIRELW